MKILSDKTQQTLKNVYRDLRKTIIGLTIVMAMFWVLYLSPMIVLLFFGAINAIGNRLISTDDLASGSPAHVQVGEYNLTIPQRYLHDDLYEPRIMGGGGDLPKTS